MVESVEVRRCTNVLNAMEVAKCLGISKAGAYNLMNSPGFPTLRVGRRLLVSEDKFVKWIDENSCR